MLQTAGQRGCGGGLEDRSFASGLVRSRHALVACLIGVLGLAGCGSSSSTCGSTSSYLSGGSDPGGGYPGFSAVLAPATVHIQGMAFNPSCLQVAVGTAVTFVNDDSVAHTVTTDAGQVESFDSGSLAPAASFVHTFNVAGTIALHCSIHPSMHATVAVQ
jgi:plastocyanin